MHSMKDDAVLVTNPVKQVTTCMGNLNGWGGARCTVSAYTPRHHAKSRHTLIYDNWGPGEELGGSGEFTAAHGEVICATQCWCSDSTCR